jgi:hypothetical protein
MKPIAKLALLVSLFLSFCSIASAESPVNFTLSLNTKKDPGAVYDNFKEAGRGMNKPYVIGFQVAIHSVNGTNVNLAPIAAFCSELQEDISVASYTFTSRQLWHLSAGQAGVPGTASSAIPSGGIGLQRAAYVSYLFDRYYISEALSEWTYTQTTPFTHAFQMALWEMTHDSDLNLMNTSGAIYFGPQTSGSATAIAQRNNAINLAQTMLLNVYNANVSSSYVSTNFNICALASTSGNGNVGFQDIILATKKGSITTETLSPLITLPEPNVQSLLTMIAGFFWFICRVRRHLYS